jgi:hypothetical protein
MIVSLTSGVSMCQLATSSLSATSVQTGCRQGVWLSPQVSCVVTTCGTWDADAIPAASIN